VKQKKNTQFMQEIYVNNANDDVTQHREYVLNAHSSFCFTYLGCSQIEACSH